MAHTVSRHDFTARSQVILKCDQCGSTVTYCDLEHADLYEQGYAEHVCSIGDGALDGRPALRRLLRHLSGL